MAGKKVNKEYYLIQNKTDGCGIKCFTYNQVLEHIKKYNTDENMFKIVKCVDLPFPDIHKDEGDNTLLQKKAEINDIIFHLAYMLSDSHNTIKNVILNFDIINTLCNMPYIQKFLSNTVDASDNVRLMRLCFLKDIFPKFLNNQYTNNNIQLFLVSSDVDKVAFMFIIDVNNDENISCISKSYMSIYINDYNMKIAPLLNNIDALYSNNKELTYVDNIALHVINTYINNIFKDDSYNIN